MKTKLYTAWGLIIAAFIFSACHEKPYSPIKGELKMASEESLFRIVEANRAEFERLYVESKILNHKADAREGIPDLFQGKINLYVCGRGFNKEELDFIQKNKLTDVKQFKFCYDAIVVLTDKGNNREKITLNELRDNLTKINNGSPVFMPPFKSSTYEYIKESLLNGKDPVNVKLCQSETDVMLEVKKNKNSLGLVGLNVIADSTDFKFLRVSSGGFDTQGDSYYEPHQYFLITGAYPLTKLCYVFTNEMVLSLGGGFATFLTGNEGQKLVRDYKLGPATVPIKIKQK